MRSLSWVGLVLWVALQSVPGVARAAVDEGSGASTADAPESPQQAPTAATDVPVDDQGRPFPDPALVRMGRSWTGAGIALTATGAALVLGGMVVGSSMARGEIVTTPALRGVLVGTMAGGAILVGAGLPTLSAGTFTTRQLLRTIRGAEKVPRTVANERSYWLAYRSSQYGQGVAIGGGGLILLGVVAVAAVAATVDTDYYDERYWLIPVGMFGGGAAMTVGGLLWKRQSDQRLESIRDAVDPYRQQESAAAWRSGRRAMHPADLLPRLALTLGPPGEGTVLRGVSLRWGFAF
ncbi:MAG: hypothetical protein CL928_13920 [Deltaproteobacteria bacterium]|nr:hypothetical protein [Deltaproteobacteria bacterium]